MLGLEYSGVFGYERDTTLGGQRVLGGIVETILYFISCDRRWHAIEDVFWYRYGSLWKCASVWRTG